MRGRAASRPSIGPTMFGVSEYQARQQLRLIFNADLLNALAPRLRRFFQVPGRPLQCKPMHRSPHPRLGQSESANPGAVTLARTFRFVVLDNLGKWLRCRPGPPGSYTEQECQNGHEHRHKANEDAVPLKFGLLFRCAGRPLSPRRMCFIAVRNRRCFREQSSFLDSIQM